MFFLRRQTSILKLTSENIEFEILIGASSKIPNQYHKINPNELKCS